MTKTMFADFWNNAHVRHSQLSLACTVSVIQHLASSVRSELLSLSESRNIEADPAIAFVYAAIPIAPVPQIDQGGIRIM